MKAKCLLPIVVAVVLSVACQNPSADPAGFQNDVVVSLASTWNQGMSSAGFTAYVGAQTTILSGYSAAVAVLQNKLHVGIIGDAEYSTAIAQLNAQKEADLAALEVRKLTSAWWDPVQILVGYSNVGHVTYSGAAAEVESQTVDGAWHPGRIELRPLLAGGSLTEYYDLNTGGYFVTGVRHLRTEE